jgi:DNA invertase Pin-like site-specific DNA recombinase
VLVVWKLDRLGRSLLDLIGLIEGLNGRGVGLRVLAGHGAMIDTTRPEGRMIFSILAVLAEFERELIRERTIAGMCAARARGAGMSRTLYLSRLKIVRTRVV